MKYSAIRLSLRNEDATRTEQGMGNRVPRSYRLDAATIEAVEAWARDHGKSNTEAVEALLEAALEGTRPDAGLDRSDDGEAVALLEANLEDMRAHVATLTGQLEAKDRQIAERDAQIRGLMDIADHAQQLHGAAMAGLIAAPDVQTDAEAAGADEAAGKGEGDLEAVDAPQEPQERRKTLWERIRDALMGR